MPHSILPESNCDMCDAIWLIGGQSYRHSVLPTFQTAEEGAGVQHTHTVYVSSVKSEPLHDIHYKARASNTTIGPALH